MDGPIETKESMPSACLDDDNDDIGVCVCVCAMWKINTTLVVPFTVLNIWDGSTLSDAWENGNCFSL